MIRRAPVRLKEKGAPAAAVAAGVGPAPARERKDVATRHRENVLAGVGAFEFLMGVTLLLGAVYVGYVWFGWWLLGAVPLGFVGVALIVTGALNFARNAIDELRDSMVVVRLGRENAKLRTENEAVTAYALQLEARVEHLHGLLAQKVTIQDNNGVREMPKYDAVDGAIAEFIKTQIFDEKGRLVGIHPNRQVKRAFPFKQGTGTHNETAYQRCVRLSLIRRDEHGNYLYVGPDVLVDALAKLR